MYIMYFMYTFIYIYIYVYIGRCMYRFMLVIRIYRIHGVYEPINITFWATHFALPISLWFMVLK